MDTRARRLLVPFFCLAAIPLLIIAKASAQDDDRLKFVIAEQQRAYAVLGEMSYRIQVAGTMNDFGPQSVHRTTAYEEISDGKGNLWGHRELPEDNIPGHFYYRTEKEFAELPQRGTHAYIYRLPQDGLIVGSVKERFDLARRHDYFRAGICTLDNLTLWEMIERSAAQQKLWSAHEFQDAAGRRLFDVQKKFGSTTSHDYPNLEFVIDPNQGFMTTLWIARRSDGSIRELGEAAYSDSGNGIFTATHMRNVIFTEEGSAPTLSAEELLKNGIATDEKQMYAEYAFEITPEFNPTYDTQIFTWKGLNLESDTQVFVKDPSQDTKVFLIRNGVLVPREVIQSIVDSAETAVRQRVVVNEDEAVAINAGDQTAVSEPSEKSEQNSLFRKILVVAIAVPLVFLVAISLRRGRESRE